MYSNAKRVESSDGTKESLKKNPGKYETNRDNDIDYYEDQNDYWDDYFERQGRNRKVNKRYSYDRYDDNEY